MSKDYQANAPNCLYCGGQLDIDALYHGRKCHKYRPNCSQRMYMLGRKIKKGLIHDNEDIKKWTQLQKDNHDNKLINGKEIDPQITLLLRTENIKSLEKFMKVTV